MVTGKQMKDILSSPAAKMWKLSFHPSKCDVGGLSFRKPPDSANSAGEMRANQAKVTRQDPSLLIEKDVNGNASLVPPWDNHATYTKLSPATEIVISYDFTGCSLALVAGNSGVAVAHIYRGGNAAAINDNAKAQLENVKKAVACSSNERVAVFPTRGMEQPKGAVSGSLIVGCMVDSAWTWYSLFVSSSSRIVTVAQISKEMWQGADAV
ncbi:MAG: hypothetical protein IPK64_02285 [bacterium]|nr:hypothetical protein [bacterium]